MSEERSFPILQYDKSHYLLAVARNGQDLNEIEQRYIPSEARRLFSSECVAGSLIQRINFTEPDNFKKKEKRKVRVYEFPGVVGTAIHYFSQISRRGRFFSLWRNLCFVIAVRSHREGKMRGYVRFEDQRAERAIKKFKNANELSLLEQECLVKNLSQHHLIDPEQWSGGRFNPLEIYCSIEVPSLNYILGAKGYREW